MTFRVRHTARAVTEAATATALMTASRISDERKFLPVMIESEFRIAYSPFIG
jgi:hypothetical protein